mmetsp:Transcript_14253/g.33127  ORF Transcript_14253/g.33127 Transcript_14253/m.33127 type:complete len:258 (+) Transcript_14253:1040-1813(+)
MSKATLFRTRSFGFLALQSLINAGRESIGFYEKLLRINRIGVHSSFQTLGNLALAILARIIQSGLITIITILFGSFLVQNFYRPRDIDACRTATLFGIFIFCNRLCVSGLIARSTLVFRHLMFQKFYRSKLAVVLRFTFSRPCTFIFDYTFRCVTSGFIFDNTFFRGGFELFHFHLGSSGATHRYTTLILRTLIYDRTLLDSTLLAGRTRLSTLLAGRTRLLGMGNRFDPVVFGVPIGRRICLRNNILQASTNGFIQ